MARHRKEKFSVVPQTSTDTTGTVREMGEVYSVVSQCRRGTPGTVRDIPEVLVPPDRAQREKGERWETILHNTAMSLSLYKHTVFSQHSSVSLADANYPGY